jgi:hypothetical protein
MRIGEFYLAPKTGVIQFVGYAPDGSGLIDKFDRGIDGKWTPMNRIKVDPRKLSEYTQNGKLKPIPPPA